MDAIDLERLSYATPLLLGEDEADQQTFAAEARVALRLRHFEVNQADVLSGKRSVFTHSHESWPASTLQNAYYHFEKEILPQDEYLTPQIILGIERAPSRFQLFDYDRLYPTWRNDPVLGQWASDVGLGSGLITARTLANITISISYLRGSPEATFTETEKRAINAVMPAVETAFRASLRWHAVADVARFLGDRSATAAYLVDEQTRLVFETSAGREFRHASDLGLLRDQLVLGASTRLAALISQMARMTSILDKIRTIAWVDSITGRREVLAIYRNRVDRLFLVIRESPNALALDDATAAQLGFTNAERAVVDLLLAGHTRKQIAAARGVRESTVKTQLIAIFRKLGVADSRQAVLLLARLLQSR